VLALLRNDLLSVEWDRKPYYYYNYYNYYNYTVLGKMKTTDNIGWKCQISMHPNKIMCTGF